MVARWSNSSFLTTSGTSSNPSFQTVIGVITWAASALILAGILSILRWGLPWRSLPLALRCGSGRTCERRFQEWCDAGAWARLLRLVLDHAEQHALLDWFCASLDSASVPEPRGGTDVGPNPTDRGKKGSTIHLLLDAQGLPLGVTVSGANVHDNQRFEQTLDIVQGVRNVGGAVLVGARIRFTPTKPTTPDGAAVPAAPEASRPRSRVGARTPVNDWDLEMAGTADAVMGAGVPQTGRAPRALIDGVPGAMSAGVRGHCLAANLGDRPDRRLMSGPSRR